MDLFRLDGKVALITGAGSPRGIGAAVGLGMAEAGAKVMLASHKKDNSEIAKSITEKTGMEVDCVRVNTADEQSVKEMVNKTIERFSKIDILVNNAATSYIYPISTADMNMKEHWQDVLDVNLNGTVNCTRLVLKHMIKNGIKGSIITTASINGIVPTTGGAHAYPASKAALVMLNQCWALENARFGIRFNAVAPGLVRTDLSAVWYSAPELIKFFEDNTPMGRDTTGEELRGIYVFLASEAASYITGSCIIAHGGGVPVYMKEILPPVKLDD